MKRQKSGPAAVSPADRAKGPATGQGAAPTKSRHHRHAKRKLPPMPIAVALRRVRPDTQIAAAMELLAGSRGKVPMPTLSRRSGSLNIHSVMSQIRKQYRWVIKNHMDHNGKGWDSDYRLISPRPYRRDNRN